MTSFSLDEILVQIGQFGKYQIINCILLSVPVFFNAIFSITYIFTSGSVVHRCNITECDGPGSGYYEPWVNYTIPMFGNELSKCTRFYSAIGGGVSGADFCSAPESFNSSHVHGCSEFVFRDKEVSISNEFGIYCNEEWKLSLVGTINNIGQFVGIPLGGIVSDKFGRRTALALAGGLSAAMGLIRSFSPNYVMFVIFEFLDAAIGSSLYPVVFIIGIELVGPKRRVFAGCFLGVFYGLGEIMLGVAAKYIQNWRTLLRVLYTPAFVHLLYLWILPESVRWLLTQKQDEEVKKTLQRAARVNKRKLSDSALDNLIASNDNKTDNDERFPLTDALRMFFWRIVICCICWFTNVMVYYGISQYSVLLGGNKYTNFILISTVGIPGYILPYFILDRFGRRYSLFGCMFLGGISVAATIFIPDDQTGLLLAMFLIGKLTITCSFQMTYMYTSEIFPTNVRHTMLSFCSSFGRIGSMLAPQTPLLAKYWAQGPSVIFSGAAILAGMLTLLFPETTDLALPSTLKEAKMIGIEL